MGTGYSDAHHGTSEYYFFFTSAHDVFQWLHFDKQDSFKDFPNALNEESLRCNRATVPNVAYLQSHLYRTTSLINMSCKEVTQGILLLC